MTREHESQWVERDRPPRLERRYQFLGYGELRDFLDNAAEISEKMALYPNMSFGRDYLNVTIQASDDNGQLGPEHRELADKFEALYAETPKE